MVSDARSLWNRKSALAQVVLAACAVAGVMRQSNADAAINVGRTRRPFMLFILRPHGLVRVSERL